MPYITNYRASCLFSIKNSIIRTAIRITNMKQGLHAANCWIKEQQVISIHKTSYEDTVNIATIARVTEKHNQIINVHIKQDTRQNPPLTYTACDCK